MTPFIAALVGVALTLVLIWLRSRYASFRAQVPADYARHGPQFDLRQHLSGPILCEGMIYGPTGRVTSRFVADMHGRWDGTTGTLAETFHYDSGTVQDRAWTLRLSNDGSIAATAADVVGTGTGRAEGSAVVLRYRIKLAPEAGGHVLDVTDWMYLMDNGTIMNRSQFRKFGIKVAELVATMRRVPAPAAMAAE
jgi:Protein of unknown function (DUF3833)